MPHSQRARTSTLGKSVGTSRMSKLLVDEGRCNPGSRYQRSVNGSSSTYFNSINGSTASTSVKQDSYASSSSASSRSSHPYTLTSVRNHVLGSSDDSGSDVDIEAGGRLVMDRPAVLQSEWVSTSVAPLLNEHPSEKDASGISAGVSAREQAQGLHLPNWRDQYISQSAKLQHQMSKQSGNYHGPIQISQRPYRKGSSSKAPQTDDLTAPLLNEKRSRSFTDRIISGRSDEHASANFAKNRNAYFRRGSHFTSMNGNALSRRTGNSQAYYGQRAKSQDMGASHKDFNGCGDGPGRRGLGNLVCSSASDVLPSVSNSVLSTFVCSSASDVLPSGTSSNFHPRKSSRSLGLLEGEAGRTMDLRKQRGAKASIAGLRENMQDGHRSPPLRTSQSRFSNHTTVPEPELLVTEVVTETLGPASSGFAPSSSSLMPNYRYWGRSTVPPRQGDGLGSFNRSSGTFLEPNPASGEDLSNQWYARRRSLYGSRLDGTGRDSRSSGRSLPHTRPSSSTRSGLSETRRTPPRFSGPPTRPPPPPPSAAFAEPSASESSFATFAPVVGPEAHYSSRLPFTIPSLVNERSVTAVPAEIGLSSPSAPSGESRPRLTVEGLSEILSALEFIERDEDLSYEQILMLEATLLLGGIGLHDRYRDMRIDIDNMSYEELLALEERIGNVNTGLSEESVVKSVRLEMFTSPKVSCGYIPQEIEIKCSICQEEFQEAAELGILECGHSHHVACIKQWLLQKNQCPICKAPALL